MRCSSCASWNSAEARFCVACGSPLVGTCPDCGAKTGPNQGFCANCGRRLAPAPGSPPAEEDPSELPSERRLVSVLFVDLKGFTSLAESLDPEDVRSLQGRYFELSRAVIGRYGGTIEKFAGDAVMAVWGAPQAHEDDGERAVRAALELVAAVARLPAPTKRRLKARAAVATGEAVVTMGGDGQGMLSGDLVNTAARLQHVAPVDGVLVDDTTKRVAEGTVVFEATGNARLRGKRQPVTTWRAHRLASAPERGRAVGHPGPFVGRDDDLGELVGLFDRTAASAHSRLVSIIGVAGVGKSRLAWEFQRRLEALPEEVVVLSGHVPAYGEGLTFAPLAEMLRSYASISDGTPADVAHDLLRQTVSASVADEQSRPWLTDRLSTLLHPDPRREFEGEELFAAWRQFFEHVASRAPTVLIFDEMQWAQPELLHFIDHLSTWSRAYPLLLISLARPELLDSRPGWGADQHNFASLHLHPLSDAAMKELLAALAYDLPEATVQQILERAGGIPLYAVEVARLLAAGELPADRLPGNLHSLVAARIDALPPRARKLLIAASVLGRRFPRVALEALGQRDGLAAHDAINLLIRRELLDAEQVSGSVGDGRLSFTQDVVREVAYSTLSRPQRRILHLAAANHLEALAEDELIEPIADHLFHSHQAAVDHPEAASVAGRAVAALNRAAQRANALHAPATALGHLERALALVDDAQVRATLWSEAATAARAAALFDRAERYLRELISWHTDHGAPAEAARSRARLASLLLATERHGSALSDLEEAVAEMSNYEDESAGVELAGQLARGRLLVGDDEKAIEWARRTFDAARRLELPAVALDALTTLGTARLHLGLSEQGRQDLVDAIEEAARLGLLRAELRARNNLAWMTVLDDPDAALEAARAGLELATRMGVADMEVQLRDVVTAVAIDTGDWDYALGILDQARDRPQAPAHRIELVTNEATLRALRGERAAAAELIETLQPIDPTIDQQVLAGLELARARLAFVKLDFADAHARARAAAHHLLGADQAAALLLAGRASLWQADGAALKEAHDRIVQLQLHGRVVAASERNLRAALAAIAGDPEASPLYEQVIGDWRALRLPLELALSLLERDRLLGGGTKEAEAILRELHADGVLALVRRVT